MMVFVTTKGVHIIRVPLYNSICCCVVCALPFHKNICYHAGASLGSQCCHWPRTCSTGTYISTTTTRSHALMSARSNLPTTSSGIFATNSQSPPPSYSCLDSQASTLKQSGGLRLSGSDLAVAVADSRCGGSPGDVSPATPQRCLEEKQTIERREHEIFELSPVKKAISSMQRASSVGCLNQIGFSFINDPVTVHHSSISDYLHQTVVSSKCAPLVSVSNRNSGHRQGQVPSSPPQRGYLIPELWWKVVSPFLMNSRELLLQQPSQAASHCCVSSEEEVSVLHQRE